MPVYEYKCSKCGKIFEYKQSMNDPLLTKCPVSICEQEVKGEGKVTRIISKNVGLVFKGSGFYVTDYVKNGDVKHTKEKSNTNGHIDKGKKKDEKVLSDKKTTSTTNS
ncbi:MAG: FmdB family zinc ribbon protein [bacterium]